MSPVRGFLCDPHRRSALGLRLATLEIVAQGRAEALAAIGIGRFGRRGHVANLGPTRAGRKEGISPLGAGPPRPCADSALMARIAPFPRGRPDFLRRPARCGSSVVEHSLGKGEVESSILSRSTRQRTEIKHFDDRALPCPPQCQRERANSPTKLGENAGNLFTTRLEISNIVVIYWRAGCLVRKCPNR
jgi:hypothetical protein